MTTTDTSTATANGTAASNTSKARLSGIARVHESEAWHAACLMHDAVFEAERLCDDINRAIYEAYRPSDNDSTAAQVASSDSTRRKADEALRLLRKAENCLTALTGTDQPPF